MPRLRRFILRCLLVMLPPVALLAGIYVAVDPFGVVRFHDDYFGKEYHYPIQAFINKGMVSSKNFRHYYPQLHHNAFIMGSSLSIFYPAAHWATYLPADAVPFHFDSSGESLRSLRLKIDYLDSIGVDLRYMLIVLGYDAFDVPEESTESVAFINHYSYDSEVSLWQYHKLFLRSFYDREFLRAYVASRVAGRVVRVNNRSVISTENKYLIAPINEETHRELDDSVRHHTAEFYAKRGYWFDRERSLREAPHKAVSPSAMEHMRHIADVLRRHGTDYEIVAGPSLEKLTLPASHRDSLRAVFGERFHDFSRSMAHKADCDTNFFDSYHYRCPVGSEIIDSVYSRRK